MALRIRPLRGLIAAAVLVACTRPRDDYEALRASLVSHDNDYAKLRLERYRAWMRLPELTAVPVPVEAARGDRAALLALGREAFFKLPLQRAPGTGHGLQHLANGAMTCATCHVHGDTIGAPNRDLDLGAAMLEAFPNASAGARAIALSWGRGRVDVSSASGLEPARIPDLRPVRHQKFLQYSGAVRHLDLTSLTLRIETLIITATDESARPPYPIARGLAMFVDSLADALPAPPKAPPVFERECAGCHEGDELVDVDEVGTDPTLARSKERGTGRYRAPTLRGVSLRAPLMHDASVASLDRLLDPDRDGGHRFGLDVTADERRALLAYLRGL